MSVAADRMAQTGENAKLFNLGCDARLRGERFREDAPWFWRACWRDVEASWGVAAKWPVRMLPEVFE